MTAESGLLDTNVVILRDLIDRDRLPAQIAISAVTLAELTAGIHATDPGEHQERAGRLEHLQRVENEFDPVPFEASAARAYGRVHAAVIAFGRSPRARIADLLIASIAMANDLPLYTINPDDFAGLDRLLTVVAVPHPNAP
jgi:predicted nucleic acid-binding protein